MDALEELYSIKTLEKRERRLSKTKFDLQTSRKVLLKLNEDRRKHFRWFRQDAVPVGITMRQLGPASFAETIQESRDGRCVGSFCRNSTIHAIPHRREVWYANRSPRLFAIQSALEAAWSTNHGLLLRSPLLQPKVSVGKLHQRCRV